MATVERVQFDKDCRRFLKRLQERVDGGQPELPARPEDLFDEVRTAFFKASRSDLLQSGQYQISKLLHPCEKAARGEGLAFSGGPPNRDRAHRDPDRCLVRDDYAVLSFSVTVGQNRSRTRLELIAYAFDLWLPDGSSPGFVRFDLDDHHSEEGLRAHIHPGNDDCRLPSPVLHPVEAIHLLLGPLGRPGFR